MISDSKHPNLFITRHAAQDTLSHAIHDTEQACSGFLLGHAHCIEHQRAYEKTTALEVLDDESLIGFYHAYAHFDDSLSFEDVQGIAQNMGITQIPKVFLAIILSTQGRVETLAYYLYDKQLYPSKLTMLEVSDVDDQRSL